jgi:hypothetical protein
MAHLLAFPQMTPPAAPSFTATCQDVTERPTSAPGETARLAGFRKRPIFLSARGRARKRPKFFEAAAEGCVSFRQIQI